MNILMMYVSSLCCLLYVSYMITVTLWVIYSMYNLMYQYGVRWNRNITNALNYQHLHFDLCRTRIFWRLLCSNHACDSSTHKLYKHTMKRSPDMPVLEGNSWQHRHVAYPTSNWDQPPEANVLWQCKQYMHIFSWWLRNL